MPDGLAASTSCKPCRHCTTAATAHLSGLSALLQGGSPVQISQRTCSSSKKLAEGKQQGSQGSCLPVC